MPMDLRSAGGELRVNWVTWEFLFKLGMRHGWEPAGTEPPVTDGEYKYPPERWRGTYFTNDYQGVTAEDGNNWADALERALPNMPTPVALGHLMEEEGEAEKEFIREFVRYCRAGGFMIG